MIAIAGGKGGCGKTTTTLGLAIALARDGERPLVVDADCDMPNLHTMADTDRRPGLDAVADGESIAVATHRSTVVPGVDILPAGTVSGPIPPVVLRRLHRSRRTLLLDCPAGATDAAATPLRHADGVLVVSTADRASLSDAVKTARMAETLGGEVLGSVVTQAETRAPLDAVIEGSPTLEPILGTVPPVDGDVLANSVVQASYDKVAAAIQRRNI